ncbi:Condensation domain-containing protein [Clostridium sp. DSM 8431]|uniref:condensation domain-containing protein n=1 Tax=Clostridium sp. DSM 8431 TaxID=1761781 RepID=UPI0008F1C3BF|nr:condensation domain-containing protein [Clostridium sp. DSM 8431]SFU55582.1 Condensation domain-containing protein [Clostridium sp. DSM 8431]
MNQNYLLQNIECDMIKIPSTPILKEKWIGAMLDQTGRNYSGALRIDFSKKCNKEKVFEAVSKTLAHYPILAATFKLEEENIVGYTPKEDVLVEAIKEQLSINNEGLTDEEFITYSGRKAYEPGLRIASSVNETGIHIWIGFWVFTCDGISIDIIIKEIADRYCGKVIKRGKSWTEYVSEKKSESLKKDVDGEKIYSKPGPYGIDAVNLSKSNSRVRTKSIPFSSSIELDKLKEAAKFYRVTLFSILFGAFQRAISRISKVDRVVTGVPFVNRSQIGDYQVVGPLSNTIPIAINTKIDKPFKAILRDIQKEIIIAAGYQDVEVSALYPKGISPRNVNYELPFPQLFNAWNSKSEGEKILLDDNNYISTKLLHNDTCRVGFEITINEKNKFVSGRIDLDVDAYGDYKELLVRYMMEDLQSILI